MSNPNQVNETSATTSTMGNKKNELLIQARKDRIAWILSSSPIQGHTSWNSMDLTSLSSSSPSTTTTACKVSSLWTDKMFSSWTQQYLPSVEQILSILLQHGMDTIEPDTSSKIEQVQKIHKEEEEEEEEEDWNSPNFCNLFWEMTWKQQNIRETPIPETENHTSPTTQKKTTVPIHLFQIYSYFLQDLQLPENAKLTQEIRSFVVSFQDLGCTFIRNPTTQTMMGHPAVSNARFQDTTPFQTMDTNIPNNFTDMILTMVQSLQDFYRKIQEESKVNFVFHPQGLYQTYIFNGGDILPKEKNAHGIVSVETCSLSTPKTLDRHADWKMHDIMMEFFLFSKCYHPSIAQLLSKTYSLDDSHMLQKMNLLYSFIQPEHLDITLWKSRQHLKQEQVEEKRSWEIDLDKPIQCIKYFHRFCSPTLIQLAILNILKEICQVMEAIRIRNQSSAHHGRDLTHNNSTEINPSIHLDTDPNRSPSVFPSADDILPLLILSIICARPKYIVSTIAFVEHFTMDSASWKGELGYSLTNFMSAVQFVRDLHLEDDPSEGTSSCRSIMGEETKTTFDEDPHSIHIGRSASTSLSISREELQRLLKKYKVENKDIGTCSTTLDGEIHDDTVGDKGKDHNIPNGCSQNGTENKQEGFEIISASAVRKARLKGQQVDINWAHQLWRQRTQNDVPGPCITEGVNLPNPEGGKEPSMHSSLLDSSTSAVDKLQRSYKYLLSEAKDIRISDVPRLLDEYKALAHVTELLLSDRSAIQQKERNQEIERKREILEMEVSKADVLLAKLNESF